MPGYGGACEHSFMSNPSKKLSVFIFAILIVSQFAPTQAGAEDVRQKLSRIQNQIKVHENNLNRATRKEQSVLAEMDRIDREMVSLKKNYNAERSKLYAINNQISVTQTAINTAQQNIEQRSSWLKKRLQGMQKQGKADEIAMILESGDMSDFIRRWKALETLAAVEKSAFEDYKNQLDILQQKQKQLAPLKTQFVAAQQRTAKAEADLNSKKSEKNALLASIRSKKAGYLSMIRDLKQQSAKLQEIIRRSEQQAGGAYNGKGFRGLKGRLQWPVQGRVALGYGRGSDPLFKTPLFRTGIYIKTEPDAIVRSVQDGKVVFADYFKGYGRLVIISHGGGYHTLYANLNEIFLKVGDIIEKNAEIGKVAESVLVGAPSLYFEVRYKGKPLDPLQWLGRK